jgi:hypothetical protein
MITREKSLFEKSVMHPRDAERFRPGGMFGTKRFYNDPPAPPAYEAQELPEDFRASDPALKDFKTVGSLRKAYLDTKSLVGSSIRVPSADAGEQDRKEFRERLKKADPDLVEIPKDPEKRKAVEDDIWGMLGRPKDAKEYALEGVALGDGVQISDEELGKLREVAQRRGYTKAQFKAFVTDVAADRAASLKAAREREAELRTEFGAAFDDKLKEIAIVAEKTGAPQSLRDSIAKKQIDKGTALYLLGIAKSLGTDTRELGDQKNRTPGALTPAEAELRIAEIMRRPEFLDGSKDPVLQRQLVAEVARLEAYASPDLARAGGE